MHIMNNEIQISTIQSELKNWFNELNCINVNWLTFLTNSHAHEKHSEKRFNQS